MLQKTVDLHIHSYYSDGTMSPKEILWTAQEKGVGIISLTDHDRLEGARELKKLCEHSKIQFISGVEMNSLNKGTTVHILGYGVDLEDKAFYEFVNRNRSMLDLISVKLIEKMQEKYEQLSVTEFLDYKYDKKKGGWKALHYLMEKRITKNLREAFPLYSKYGCNYDCVDFPSTKEVCESIRKAGGRAVLAHPGVTIKTKNIKEFKNELLRLMELGVDGIECYYPTHTKEITELCIKMCKEQNMLITSGADCHGSFGDTEIGELDIPVELLDLGDLVGR